MKKPKTPRARKNASRKQPKVTRNTRVRYLFDEMNVDLARVSAYIG